MAHRGFEFAILLVTLSSLWSSFSKAEPGDTIYHGQVLPISLQQALREIQQTGTSHNTFNEDSSEEISGSGDIITDAQYKNGNLEVSVSSPYKSIIYGDIAVVQFGSDNGSYGISLKTRDPVTVLGGNGGGGPYYILRLSLYDPDTSRIRHVADLLATLGARLGGGLSGASGSIASGNVPPYSRGSAQQSSTNQPLRQPQGQPFHSTGSIVAQIDSASLNSNGGTNYVHFRNVGDATVTLTAWTTNCTNLEIARCGTILRNVRVLPGREAGFWINRHDDNQPWSYSVGCNVSGGAIASCDAAGGGDAAPPWQAPTSGSSSGSNDPWQN